MAESVLQDRYSAIERVRHPLESMYRHRSVISGAALDVVPASEGGS